MSYLDTIIQADEQDEPPVITLAGDVGTGKSTLAAMFPDPIFIQAEKGVKRIQRAYRPPAFPALDGSFDTLERQLTSLITEDHDYKTLAIDTVTQLELDFIKDVVKSDDKAQSINQACGGYGGGADVVAHIHARVKRATEILRLKKGMTIIFLAHTKVKSMDLPNIDPYMLYNIAMHDKSCRHYINDADLVGFMRDELFVNGTVRNNKGEVTKTGKAVGSGRIVLTSQRTPWSCSKNAFSITSDIIIEEGENPLLDLIPYYKQQEEIKS